MGLSLAVAESTWVHAEVHSPKFRDRDQSGMKFEVRRERLSAGKEFGGGSGMNLFF